MTPQEMANLQAAVLHSAEAILTDYFHTTIHLQWQADLSPYPDSPFTIWRLALLAPPDDAPATVVVKFTRAGLEPLRFEWASLEFLSQVPAIQAIVPKFFGGRSDPLLVVMADLGDDAEQKLGHFLDGQKPPKTAVELAAFQKRMGHQAEAALVAFQRALGQLHAATIGKQAEFEQIRQRCGASVRSRHRVHNIVPALEALPAIAELVDVSVSAQAMAELETAVAHIQNPGPFLAFTHGDSTPANFLSAPNQSRLLDFETGDFRHTLLDGTYARMRYLYSIWAREIPLDMQKRLFTVYRAELGQGCPAAYDDAQFYPAYLACSAGWMAGLCQFLPKALEKDRRWGRSTRRQRIVAGLEHFARLADEFDLFPALKEISQQMNQQLRQHWPEPDCTLPIYSAFRAV